MNRMEQGVLIMELVSSDPTSRIRKLNLYSALFVMPLVFTLVLFFSHEAFEHFGLLVPVAIFLYGIPVPTYLFLQHIFGRYMLPAYVYSEGIQLPISWWSRIAKRTTFIKKDEIAEISVHGMAGKDERGPFEHRAYFVLITKTGKRYFVAQRDPGQMFSASEYIRKEWGTKIIIKKDEAQEIRSPTGRFLRAWGE